MEGLYLQQVETTPFIAIKNCTLLDFFHAQTGSHSNLAVLSVLGFRYPVAAVQKSAWRDSNARPIP